MSWTEHGRVFEVPGLDDTSGQDLGGQEECGDEAGERQQPADAALVALLAQHGFSGPVYEKFELGLYEYGRPILLAWLRTGEIFARCGRRNLRLGMPPRPFTADDRAQLTDDTLTSALRVFRRRALIQRGWNPGQATLSTYFVSGLPVHFCNPYRSWCRQARKDIAWQDQVAREFVVTDVPDFMATSDPQQLYILRETLQEELSGLKAEMRAILILMNEGYTYKEIAEIQGVSPESIEAKVYRHRKNMRRRPGTERG
jgi:DNA-directed RNA polymerase specialized sigma24 family protein